MLPDDERKPEHNDTANDTSAETTLETCTEQHIGPRVTCLHRPA